MIWSFFNKYLITLEKIITPSENPSPNTAIDVIELTSVENSGSFTWHGYSVNLLRKVDNTSLYQMAREFYGSLKRSQVNAESSPQEESNY